MRYGIRWFKCKLKPPKNATEQERKSFADSNYQEFLETTTNFEKQTFDTWNQTIHTEKHDDNTGKTHGGPQSRNTKLPLNPEGKIKHRTTSFLLPEDCVKEQKQVISEILESIESHNKEEHRGNDCGSTHKKNEVCCFSICKQTEQVNVTILDESGCSLRASGLLFSHMM